MTIAARYENPPGVGVINALGQILERQPLHHPARFGDQRRTVECAEPNPVAVARLEAHFVSGQAFCPLLGHGHGDLPGSSQLTTRGYSPTCRSAPGISRPAFNSLASAFLSGRNSVRLRSSMRSIS